MAFTVRRTTVDEWREFKALRLKALQDYPMAFGTRYEDVVKNPDSLWQDRAVQNATAEAQAFYVAADEATGELVGMWGVMPHFTREHAQIVIGVYLLPEARGTDVARRLNQAVIDFARGTDAKELTLLVRDDNDRGCRFYEREGWVLTGYREPHNLDPSHDLVEMRYPDFR